MLQVITSETEFIRWARRFTGRTLFSTQESLDNIPVCRSLDHTMSTSLDEYVCQKLPTKELLEAIALGYAIEVHGLTPGYLESAPEEFGISYFSKIPWKYFSSVKECNNIRPTFYKVRRDSEHAIFVVVPFGQDYLRHYSALIRHFITMHTLNYHGHIRVTRYPQIEVEMTEITSLNAHSILPGDTVVLGYVNEFTDLFVNRFGKPISFFGNSYYTSQRYKVGNRTVNFLGVKYSFWGSISRGLVNKICELGASEVIYAAKLGTLGSETEIYNKIFSPSQYFIFDHLTLKAAIKDLKNPFLNRFPQFDTGAHASVPTVLEETYEQRGRLEKFEVQSIDNEISQMADTLVQFNKRNAAQVPFFCLHFATDYLRKSNEKLAFVTHDLSSNRTQEATRQKRGVLEKVASLLADYLENT